MAFIVTFFLFILGASLGSFLSVVIHRFRHEEKGIVSGRSRCPHCRKMLAAKDLIPLLSFLFLGGKCRYCKIKLSPHYFFLELICSIVAVLLFLKFPFVYELAAGGYTVDWNTFFAYIFFFIDSMFLVGIFFYDLQYMEIPTLFLYPLIIITLIGSLVLHTPDLLSLHIAFWAALIFFGGQILLSKGKWLGEGDLYLGISMAFIFGWKLLIVAVTITYVLGAIISLILITSQKAHAKTKIPFAPFMVIGSFATIFIGDQLIDWYLKLLNI